MRLQTTLNMLRYRWYVSFSQACFVSFALIHAKLSVIETSVERKCYFGAVLFVKHQARVDLYH